MKKSKRSAAKNNNTARNMNTAPAVQAEPVVQAEPAEDMVLQFGENEVSIAAISDKVKQNYKESGNEAALNVIKIYIKPEDNRAYYVANGEIEGSVELVSG